MKKFLVLGICLAAMSTAAFAQADLRFSAGGGLAFQDYWTTYSGKPGSGSPVTQAQIDAMLLDTGSSYTGLNIFAFFDATYVEVDLGLAFGGNIGGLFAGASTTSFTLSLYGKYPISLSEQLTVFPLLGFDYNIWW
jgi:hypothetical protein